MPLSPSMSAVAGPRSHHLDLRVGIDAAGAYRPDILCDPEDAVRIGAGEVGFDHRRGDASRIGIGHAAGDERLLGEGQHGRDGEAAIVGCHVCS